MRTIAFGRAGRASVVVLAALMGTIGMAAEPSAAASKQKKCVAKIKKTFGGYKTMNFCNIKNVKYIGVQKGKNYVGLAQGKGPMTLTLTSTVTVSNSKSSDISVTAGSVSSAVKFDVTKSRTQAMAGSYTVPKGKFGALKAYPLYKVYSFKAYSKLDGKFVTKGVARKAIGYRYEHSAK
ncbi:hypothetical protein [Streptomyces graminofaciens]|nr:hypothetical protein [Streptomyces graminofaciens]